MTIPLIHSLLETDLYKFTMWQTMLHRHPQAQAEYRFLCRNASAYPLASLAGQVNEQLDALCTLRFTQDELDYLRGLRYIKSDFVDFLRLFQFQRDFIQVRTEGDTLEIVARGPQVHVMGFEIPVLALVNELYFQAFDADAARREGRARLDAKLALLRAHGQEPACRHPFEFFDFGVRRRHSGAWQEEVVRTLKREAPAWFKGTSNVHLARTLDLVPIGTMAHEYLQSYQAMDVRLRDFQKATWAPR
jgi:nicotinate phosphoribosyltransferase